MNFSHHGIYSHIPDFCRESFGLLNKQYFSDIIFALFFTRLSSSFNNSTLNDSSTQNQRYESCEVLRILWAFVVAGSPCFSHRFLFVHRYGTYVHMIFWILDF